MHDAEFPVTSSVVQLMSRDTPGLSRDKIDEVADLVRKLEQDAKDSVWAAAKYYGRKSADLKRQKESRKARARKKPDISILPLIDSESKKVRKRSAVEKDMGDLFGNGPPDDWPEDFGDQFWAAWPRHFRKAAKKDVFKKLARIRKSREATWAELFGGVTAYFASNPEYQWIPAPEVWLNKQRWQADYSRVGTGRKMTMGDIMRGGIARHG